MPRTHKSSTPAPELEDNEIDAIEKIEIDFQKIAHTYPPKFQVTVVYKNGTRELDLMCKDTMACDMFWHFISAEDQLILKKDRDQHLSPKSPLARNPNRIFQPSNSEHTSEMRSISPGIQQKQ